jgi:hypothetical protein
MPKTSQECQIARLGSGKEPTQTNLRIIRSPAFSRARARLQFTPAQCLSLRRAEFSDRKNLVEVKKFVRAAKKREKLEAAEARAAARLRALENAQAGPPPPPPPCNAGQ